MNAPNDLSLAMPAQRDTYRAWLRSLAKKVRGQMAQFLERCAEAMADGDQFYPDGDWNA